MTQLFAFLAFYLAGSSLAFLYFTQTFGEEMDSNGYFIALGFSLIWPAILVAVPVLAAGFWAPRYFVDNEGSDNNFKYVKRPVKKIEAKANFEPRSDDTEAIKHMRLKLKKALERGDFEQADEFWHKLKELESDSEGDYLND